MQINKNKINKKKISIYFLFFFIFNLVIFSVIALLYLFKKQKKEEIKLLNDFPIFDIERIGGNNEEKILIPVPIPNFNKNKYEYLITIDHVATLWSKGTEIKEPLFLKIEIILDSVNTFNNPKDYFNIQITTIDQNNKKEIYKEDKKPCYFEMKENKIQKIQINTQIEQKKIINDINPKLCLIYDYGRKRCLLN